MAGQGRGPDRYGPVAAEEGRRVRATLRVVGRLRKPHGQQGEVHVVPLVEHPGAMFTPGAEVYVLDAERTPVAGPLVVTRRRAYHRAWLLGFRGVTSRSAVEGWRDHLVGVDEAGSDDVDH